MVSDTTLSTDTDRVIPTFCHGCGPHKPNCGLLCHVRAGRFIRVEGNPAALNNGVPGSTSLCAKGYTGPQYVYASDRLTHPLKRVGAKGEGLFARITWDEALDTIATKLKEAKEAYGPESYGVLAPENWPVLSTLGRRFLNVHGSPNYMHSAICALPRAAALTATVGFRSFGPDDWLKTKLIVNWGGNPENSKVNGGTPNAVLDARVAGAKLIDIRPMLDPLATKADMWLPVRPGTDCALALALLHVLIGEGLFDGGFVANWCYGFDRLKEHVQQYPPEWAAHITGVPAEQIREAARLIGTTRPMFVNIGNGIGDQARDGTSTVMAVALIIAITGNLDVPGGYYARPGVRPGPVAPLSTLPELAPPDLVDRLVAPESPRWYQAAGHNPGGSTSAYYKGLTSILSGDPYPLRVLNASCSNPLSATRNPRKVAEALRKLDFMFAMDIFQAPHLAFADIVLPACTTYEQDDYFCVRQTDQGTWIAPYNKVVEPLGESRSDWRLYLDLAVRMDYGEHFWYGDIDACMDEMLAPFGLTWAELRRHPQGMFAPLSTQGAAEPVSAAPAEDRGASGYRRYSLLFKGLPYGKVQCYNEFLGGKESSDGTRTLPHLPEYMGPPEGLAETPELATEYPLVLSDVHAHRLSQHSFMHNVPYLRELQPYPWIKINPATARDHGIVDGDWVRVESPYGWCIFKVEYFEGISPQVLMTKRGWWQSCPELDLPGYPAGDGGSEVNNLYNTDPALFDPFYSQMPKQTLVKICKWKGPRP